MVKPRNHPRDYCQLPFQFGKADDVRWVVPDAEDRVNMGAAQLQHAYVVRIRAGMHARKMNLKSYAAAVNCKYDRMSKLLRGVLPMRLDDVVAADLTLGNISGMSQPIAPGATASVPTGTATVR